MIDIIGMIAVSIIFSMVMVGIAVIIYFLIAIRKASKDIKEATKEIARIQVEIDRLQASREETRREMHPLKLSRVIPDTKKTIAWQERWCR